MLILLALPSTEGAAVYTGCVGGGEAVPRRGLGGPWLGRPLRRLTVSRARKALGSSRSRRLPATTSRAQWGCIGACQKGRRRAVSDRRRLGEKAAQTARGARRLASKK